MAKKFLKMPFVIATVSLASILVFVSCAYTLKSFNTISRNEIVEKNQEQLNSALHFQQTLRLIAQSLKPTVVNIQVTLKPVKTQSFMGDRMMDELLRRFFGQGGGQRDPQESEPDNGGAAVGSGFIISDDGYVVTNAHVVRNAQTISVTLEDQTNYDADLVGLDAKTDIALLKIKAKEKLRSAPLGDSDSIEAGDFAVAIGNPFGLTGTLTFGIISAKGRNNFVEENAAYKNYIQTDVPINPGNSGGPLINIRGQVVGLNSAIYSTSGGSIGIGFAIPINIVKNVITQLLQTGHVTRGTIGVLMGPVTKDIVKAYKLPNNQGILVNDVMKGTPAEKAGLQIWDVVTSVNGKKVEDPGDFIGKISALTPGQKVVLGVVREGKPLKIEITISNKDFSQGSTQDQNSKGQSPKDNKTDVVWEGTKLMTVNQARRSGLSIPDSFPEGVIVIEVDRKSKIAKAGVMPGDMLVSINKKPVKSLNDVLKYSKENKVSYVQFKSSRMGRNLLVVLP